MRDNAVAMTLEAEDRGVIANSVYTHRLFFPLWIMNSWLPVA